MRIDVFTIFPDLVTGFAGQALLGKAQDDQQLCGSDVHEVLLTLGTTASSEATAGGG